MVSGHYKKYLGVNCAMSGGAVVVRCFSVIKCKMTMTHICMVAAAVFFLFPMSLVADELGEEQIELGRKVSFDSMKGNCLACHMMPGGEQPGNFGPPLIQMKARFPERSVLHRQIWDATEKNPKSIMPPFGKHGILSEEEMDAVVDYMYAL